MLKIPATIAIAFLALLAACESSKPSAPMVDRPAASQPTQKAPSNQPPQHEELGE